MVEDLKNALFGIFVEVLAAEAFTSVMQSSYLDSGTASPLIVRIRLQVPTYGFRFRHTVTKHAGSHDEPSLG